MTWRPSADLDTLRQRAILLATLRHFFHERGVLEVETPLLARGTITDPSLKPLTVTEGDAIDTTRYLQTSPEYHMKRLLAAHGEPIYQICKAFRDGEVGPRHNPEFTLLEWYRPGYDLSALMDEVETLICECLGPVDTQRTSYAELFEEATGLNPHSCDVATLEARARDSIDMGDMHGDKDFWLDLLMTHVVEPTLQRRGLVFVYDYPASQAALAQLETTNGVTVGKRFEAYLHGIELANGYQELTDASEQRMRFGRDNAKRAELGVAEMPLDEALLSAMALGLPGCSGVALGLDRLLMAITEKGSVKETMAFDWRRA